MIRKRKTLLMTLAIGLYTAGCATHDYGPIGTEAFEPAVRTGTGSQEIFLSGKALLWQGRSAYDAQREFGSSAPTPLQGVLVLLEDRLEMLNWNPESSSYSASLSIDYPKIRNLRWDMHGFGKMVQFDADGFPEKITFSFINNFARNTTAMRILGQHAGGDFDLNSPVE